MRFATGETFTCIIIVAFDGLAFMYSAPKPVTDTLYGSVLDDNQFRGYPEKPGVYECVVKISTRADYEDDLFFFVQDTTKLADKI